MLENPVPPLDGVLMEGLKQAHWARGQWCLGHRRLASAEQAASSCGLDTDFIYFSSAGIVAPMTTVRNQTELPRENHNVL